MSIRENQLPIAESLAEGDKVRIVTSDGDSKSIDAGSVGGGVLVIGVDLENGYLKKTWKEIYDNVVDGVIVVLQMSEPGVASNWIVSKCTYGNGNYYVYALDLSNTRSVSFHANSENGYPKANTN